MEDKQKIRFVVNIILFFCFSIALFMGKRDVFTYVIMGGLTLEIVLYFVTKKYPKLNLFFIYFNRALIIAMAVYVFRSMS